jgi:hypothetical protein
MREVIIQSWCDECAAEGTNTIAKPIDITWRNREICLDLCDQHATPFTEVERLIATYGTVKKNTKRQLAAPKTFKPMGTAGLVELSYTEEGWPICPECEFQAKNIQGLSAHRRTRHGIPRTSGRVQ